jgi:hypothetical protein
MTNTTGDNYQGFIPGQTNCTTVEYNIYASDNVGNNATHPGSGYHSFFVGPLTTLESVFVDDIESGTNGWTHASPTGGVDEWGIRNHRNHTSGGSYAWKAGSSSSGGVYANNADGALETPIIALQDAPTLKFWMWGNIEQYSSTQAWDAARVELSVNGGAFNSITPVGGYSHTLYSSSSVPWGSGVGCWSGSFGWTEVEFDLSAYANQNVQIRFRFGSDTSVQYEGWYIDDVVITAPDCNPVPLGVLEGTVTDGSLPIAGVLVSADDGGGNNGADLTASDGTYSINLPASTYTVTATHAQYQDEVIPGVVVLDSATTILDIVMSPLPQPDIDWSPSEVIGQALPGGSDTEVLTIYNVGNADLTFTSDISIDPLAAALSIPRSEFVPEDAELTNNPNNFDSYKAPYAGPKHLPEPNVILQGGDNIGSATTISSLPYSNSGTTVGYSNDYDEVCPYSGSTSPDVVYEYAAPYDMILNVTLCNGSSYDTKLYIYENTAGNLVDCNDDECPGWVSELLGVALTGGNTYYFVVDGYGGDAGSCTIDINEIIPPLCDDPNVQYGQPGHLPADAWSAGTSDPGPGIDYLRYDSFGGVTGFVDEIKFWGLDLYFNGSAWVECVENPMPITVTFYQDNAGQPGTVVQTYSNLSLTPTPTGNIYNGFELNEYSTSLSPAVSLSSGWVSIQGGGDPSCWFLWMSSGTGDASSLFWDGSTLTTVPYDLSFCLNGADLPSWLSIDYFGGTVPSGGGSAIINVLMDAANLSVGVYTGSVDITSNDPDEPFVQVPVTFNVVDVPPGNIEGTVSGPYGAVENVYVTASGTAVEDYSDVAGFYNLSGLTPGTYDVTFTHADHRDTTVTGVSVTSNNTTILDVTLEELPGFVSGIVTDTAGAPIEGIYVEINTPAVASEIPGEKYKFSSPKDDGSLITAIDSVYTNAAGYYVLNVPSGGYDVSFSHIDYHDSTFNGISVTPDDTTTLSISLYPINDAPVITSPLTATATEDILFSYTGTATDPDGTTPAINFEDYASWLTPAGNDISGTPLEGYVDTSFTIIATDGELSDTAVVAVTVVAVNDPPQITSPDTANATEDEFFVYVASATDPEGSVPTLSFENYPVWMSVDADSIFGTPLEGNPDTVFTVIANDGELADTLVVNVAVEGVNDAPIITSADTDEAFEDVFYVYHATADDPDGLFRLLVL